MIQIILYEEGFQIKTQFCEVCKEEIVFERLETPEEVKIRGTTLLVNHEYDQCVVCKTFYEPLEAIDKNLLNDFAAYREQVGYMQPKEVQRLREEYQLNVRQFAAMLDMDYRRLIRIEQGALQNAYENTLFRLAACPKAMAQVARNRRDYIPLNMEDILETIDNLCPPRES